MLSGLRKFVLISLVSVVGLGVTHSSMAEEKNDKPERTGMYDENSPIHIKNYHKYGYQNGRDNHHRYRRDYRRGTTHYGRYGYENRHRPKYRQSRRYYTHYGSHQ